VPDVIGVVETVTVGTGTCPDVGGAVGGTTGVATGAGTSGAGTGLEAGEPAGGVADGGAAGVVASGALGCPGVNEPPTEPVGIGEVASKLGSVTADPPSSAPPQAAHNNDHKKTLRFT
jgi:hypothetical protein